MNAIHSQTPDCSANSHMNFQYELHIESFEFPKAYDSEIVLLSQSFGDDTTAIIEQGDDSLYSIVDPFLSSSEDSSSSSGKHSKFPCQNQNVSVSQNFPQQRSKLMDEDATICSHNQPYCSSVHRESSTSKKRLRWNEDLHKQFVIIVNSLGGPQKAKPKAILEKMDSDLLTICHTKSHLQNYRTTVHMQKALQEGFVERHRRDGVAELQAKIHKQIQESQQLQLHVQKSLDQQLEIQRSLEVLIMQQREHAKYQV